jgi:hypothetical protein
MCVKSKTYRVSLSKLTNPEKVCFACFLAVFRSLLTPDNLIHIHSHVHKR